MIEKRLGQAVILAGGLGTRLGEDATQVPKILQTVAGRPFIDYLMGFLIEQGYCEFVFCLAHLAEQVSDYLADNFSAENIVEHRDEVPCGTGMALVNARHLLKVRFAVIMGDTYFPCDHGELWRVADRRESNMMAVTDQLFDPVANVELSGSMLAVYHLAPQPNLKYADAGTAVLSKDILNSRPFRSADHCDLGEIVQSLVAQGAMGVLPVDVPFYDIGTPARRARLTDQVIQRGLLRESHDG